MTMLLHSINPSTGEILRSFPALTEEGLRERIALAAEAAVASAALPVEHRARCLRKLAQLFAEEADELARTIALETGKPIRAAAAEVARCQAACIHYAEYGVRMLAPEMLQTGSPGSAAGRTRQSYIALRPLGVLLAVLGWESPLWQACRTILPALTAGNAVLLKLAPSVPQIASLLQGLVRRAGFPRGALSALLMEDRLVEAALHDSHVVAVTAVGTEPAGRALAAQAGWLLKKSSVHLLANGATVVMPSAHLPDALAAATAALTAGTQGGKRLIVHPAIYNDFVRRLVEAVEALRVGDPLKPETEVGPLGTKDAARALSEQVDAAVKAGGRVLTGGTPLVGKGNFFEPTLLSDVPRESPSAREVLTGPVAMLFRADGLADAISLANSAPDAGDSSVWTREPSEQQQLLDGMGGSSITLNASQDVRPSVAGAATTGGFGTPGMDTLRDFTQAKTVSLG